MSNFTTFKQVLYNTITLVAIVAIFFCMPVYAKSKKAKFYDFSDQLINGEIKKPATIYMEARARAKFAKLLRLKKSFRYALILTSKDPLLK
tara:strand:- start:313 stop:585 length:273 start_codon:yes stop_codon:yes gene_type:complete